MARAACSDVRTFRLLLSQIGNVNAFKYPAVGRRKTAFTEHLFAVVNGMPPILLHFADQIAAKFLTVFRTFDCVQK